MSFCIGRPCHFKNFKGCQHFQFLISDLQCSKSKGFQFEYCQEMCECCSQVIQRDQPWLILTSFKSFGHNSSSCFYKIDLMKKKRMLVSFLYLWIFVFPAPLRHNFSQDCVTKTMLQGVFCWTKTTKIQIKLPQDMLIFIAS